MELNRAKNLDTTLLQKLKTMKKLNMMRKIEWRERLQLQIDNFCYNEQFCKSF